LFGQRVPEFASAKGRHNLFGEKAHGFFDFFVGDAAEIESRG
jgi:hypothetical protein